jgi:hypothetical protein
MRLPYNIFCRKRAGSYPAFRPLLRSTLTLRLEVFYLAMQTFFGSVKNPAFAKATARQAPRFAELFISLYKCSSPP